MTEIVHKVMIELHEGEWSWRETTENVRHTGFPDQYQARLHAIDTLQWDDNLIKIEWIT